MAVKDFFKYYIYPMAVMAGSIIGVGFLALPYITLKVGIVPMLVYFVVVTALVITIHVIFGRISLQTPDYKRWPGFVKFYLGNGPRNIVLILNTVGLFGVLLVYLIVGSQFLTAILNPYFGGSQTLYAIVYFLGVSIFIFGGVKAIAKLDFFALCSLLIILFFIFIKSLPHMSWQNIFQPAIEPLGWKNLLLPYGAIMFSLWNLGLIPEVEEMLIGNKKSLQKVIIASIVFAAIFYLVFIFLVLGITGRNTTDSALTGLKEFFGNGLTSVALLIGVTTTFIAFIAQGLLLKKIFMYDLGMKEFNAFLLVCLAPLALFFMGLNSFIPIISFIGGVLLSVDGILVLLVYRKIGGRKTVVYPLVLIFVLAIAHEAIQFFQ